MQTKLKKVMFIAIIGIILAFFAYQSFWYKNSLMLLEATIQFTEYCIKDVSSCDYLRATNRNLEDSISKLIPPLSNKIRNSDEYIRLNEELWPKAQPGLAVADKELMESKQRIAELEKIGQIFEEDKTRRVETEKEFRNEYEKLGSPKLLYSCNGELKYVAGKGFSNYNSIYLDAKEECGENGNFKIIDSEK